MGLKDLVDLFRRVDRLLALEDRHGALIKQMLADVDELKLRVTRLESREDIVIERAQSAASAAASKVMMAAVADTARRIGRLEERSDTRRLGSPE